MKLRGAVAAALAVALSLTTSTLLSGCQHTTSLGSAIECRTSAECAPPSTVCGSDGHCAPGCSSDPAACVGGSICDSSTGTCSGGVVIGGPCAHDSDCDPPALVCNLATRTCAAGCDLDPALCSSGSLCNMTTGHCCAVGDSSCAPLDMGDRCAVDGDCAAVPGTVCLAGTCVASCAKAGCPSSQTCDGDGHCRSTTGQCARDADCDAASYCVETTGTCATLLDPGKTSCAGGAIDRDTCNRQTSVTAWRSCIGPPGPDGCPYCVDGSCYHPGYCVADADCHKGDTCVAGLCRPATPQCPASAIVLAADVADGRYAAGHEVCVRDEVVSGSSQYDGDVELILGAARLSVILTPQYGGAGIDRPPVGATITVHGPVRWNQWHDKWELHPIDYLLQ